MKRLILPHESNYSLVVGGLWNQVNMEKHNSELARKLIAGFRGNVEPNYPSLVTVAQRLESNNLFNALVIDADVVLIRSIVRHVLEGNQVEVIKSMSRHKLPGLDVGLESFIGVKEVIHRSTGLDYMEISEMEYVITELVINHIYTSYHLVPELFCFNIIDLMKDVSVNMGNYLGLGIDMVKVDVVGHRFNPVLTVNA